jgi:methylmalonic aciduria homocystinuria type C protein
MSATAIAVDRFRAACAEAGFDLVQPFGTAWCTTDPDVQLPDFGRASALAFVVGNTRALWPVLVAAMRRSPGRIESEHVVDAWAEERITAAAAAVGAAHEIRWAHTLGDTVVPIQRLAGVSGLAWLSPANLSIHPLFGPWIGLRAVVVFDLAGPALPAPTITDPCGQCAHACLPAFVAAQRADGPQAWRAWLAVRDACPLGRAWRYAEDQVIYHYTKDRDILRLSAGS